MSETIFQKMERSPFKNVYWFARYLLNTDQYGALGKAKESQMLRLVSVLESLIVQKGMSDSDKIRILKETLAREILSMVKENTKNAGMAENLIGALDREIQTLDDVVIFCFTMKYVIAPINRAVASIPSDDAEFCKKAAVSILDALGEKKAGLVISTWDNLGVRGCLDAERASVVEEFTRLIDNLSSFGIIDHSALEDNMVLTAFVQEFERRLGQKRKARGGNSLESVVQFLFDYYHFPSTEAPSHFDQDLEVDKWFKCKDDWLIGISCKRTLRERWKQVSQADRGTLSHFKIKELWHIITYDKDLSDDKLVRLGEQRQVFYLMDDSEVYLRCSKHVGMKAYVRPLSTFIEDIRALVKHT